MSLDTETALELVAGYEHVIPLTLDDGANPIDLTGSTIYFAGKRKYSDDDDEAVFAMVIEDHVNPEAGQSQATIDLTAASEAVLESGERLVGQILVVDAGGTLVYEAKFPIQIEPTVLREIPA